VTDEMVSKREFSAKQREKLAAKGKAMPGGGFPIASRQDLLNAIKAVGRASDPEAARTHIIERAKKMDLVDLLPEAWGVSKGEPGSGDVHVDGPFMFKPVNTPDSVKKRKKRKKAQ